MKRAILLLASLGAACSSGGSGGTAQPVDSGADAPGLDSSSGGSAGSGGAAGSGGSSGEPADAPSDSGPFASGTEQEPNDGNPATAVNPMQVPGQMSGKLDPADDIDIFSIGVGPGEFWEWTLAPASGELAPHLTVFDTAPNNLNPTVLALGSAGQSAKLEHFVLRTGSFVAAVRDSRNVPDPSGFGGPGFGYTLTAKPKPIAPVPVSFPATKSGTLPSLSSVHLFQFSGTQGLAFTITVRAKTKQPPSTLDSRLSLFDATNKAALLTNDDAGGSTDSLITGSLPATAEYLVILENEGTNPADLSYQLEFALK